MTKLYYDKICLEHFPTPSHPEHPDRLRSAWSALEQRGLLERCDLGAIQPADPAQIGRIHEQGQIDRARSLCQQGGGYLDADTPVDDRSFEVSLWAAGACLSAVDGILAGDDPTAFCLIRPPGHHATQETSMGFCLFNNIALAASHTLEKHQLDRVMIVDWDVHHGNGTQDIFYGDPAVMFFSAHRFPFYPGTGQAQETGTGPGLGFTRNLPIAFSTQADAIVDGFTRTLEEAATASRPQLVLLSAGFDAHHQDPVGGLALDREHFLQMLERVRDVASTFAEGRLLSVLEGGYNVDLLGDLVADHVEGLLEGPSAS